jgi:predicted DNA-binding protein with PD1-like motif
MDYVKGKIGRYFFVRFDHNDNLLDKLCTLARKEQIRQAWFFCLGAVKHAEIVTGPKTTVHPPIPLWHKIVEGHEVIAIGNITWLNDEPKIHLHGSFGRSDNIRVGCVRKNAEVFLTVECSVFEIDDVTVVREKNPTLGIDTISFKK